MPGLPSRLSTTDAPRVCVRGPARVGATRDRAVLGTQTRSRWVASPQLANEWRTPKGRACFALEAVSWYKDCGELMLETVASKNENGKPSAIDAVHACAYESRLNVLPDEYFTGVL